MRSSHNLHEENERWPPIAIRLEAIALRLETYTGGLLQWQSRTGLSPGMAISRGEASVLEVFLAPSSDALAPSSDALVPS